MILEEEQENGRRESSVRVHIQARCGQFGASRSTCGCLGAPHSTTSTRDLFFDSSFESFVGEVSTL